MSNLTGRIFNLAKSHLDAIKDHLSEVDAEEQTEPALNPEAQAELDKSMTHDDIPTAPSDPMERARQKIAHTQGRNAAHTEVPPPSSDVAPPDPVRIAYKVIGVLPGSDFLTVESAVNKLRERVSPSKFPEGSQEQQEAKVIGDRVEEAFRTLRTTLDPNAGRFDRLEI